jgi:hypothetical protein
MRQMLLATIGIADYHLDTVLLLSGIEGLLYRVYTMDNVIKMPSHSYDTTNRSAKPMEPSSFAVL